MLSGILPWMIALSSTLWDSGHDEEAEREANSSKRRRSRSSSCIDGDGQDKLPATGEHRCDWCFSVYQSLRSGMEVSSQSEDRVENARKWADKDLIKP
jgi:hypothetical protein